MNRISCFIAIIVQMLWTGALAAAELAVIGADGTVTTLETGALYDHPQAREIAIVADPAYEGAPTAYRAVPVHALLAEIDRAGRDMVKAVALDGFVAELPLAPLMNSDPDGAVAYIAVEPMNRKWPNLPEKDAGPGPFYLVWVHPERSGIMREQWPYQVARLELATSIASRYPALLVAEDLAADHPARAGQDLFLTQCFVCHRMNGAGDAEMGPDLNLPMNPTEYFRDAALAAYIRDPSALRTWPGQQMPAFPPDDLSDDDIATIVAYLRHMAGRKAN